MHGSKRTRTAVVTESAGQAVLRRGSADALAPDEERLMRMRLGASLPSSAKLEQIAVSDDARIEIMARELEAFLRVRAAAPTAQRAAPQQRPRAPSPVPSRTKEKIVRALRRKT